VTDQTIDRASPRRAAWVGPALCLISAAGFGAMAVFGSLAYERGVSTEALLVVRFSLAAVCVVALLAAQRGRSGLRAGSDDHARVPGRVLGTAFVLGAVCYALQARLYFTALHHMDATLLALIFYTYPTLVTIAAVALGRDRFTRGRFLALVVASLGMLLVLGSSGGSRSDAVGVVLAFGAAITYTVYILVSDKIVDRIPALTLSAWVMSGAAVSLIVQALLTGGVDLGFGFWGWFWAACIAIVSTVMAMALFFAGLRRTGPSTAAILSTFEPVVTTVLAGLVLAQVPTMGQVAGGLLVLASVVLVRERRQAKQDDLAHLQATAVKSGH
jgi:drug/metabolite transporter (DMT)-like permease